MCGFYAMHRKYISYLVFIDTFTIYNSTCTIYVCQREFKCFECMTTNCCRKWMRKKSQLKIVCYIYLHELFVYLHNIWDYGYDYR